MKKYFELGLVSLILLVGLFGFLSVSGQSAQEVSIYFQSVGLDKEAATVFRVNVYIDSAVELNAYEFDFKYPENILTFLRADTAGSIINVMPEEIFSDSSGVIYLRGGSTTPFSGTAGLLASFYFKPKTQGSGTIGFTSAVVHVADGKGTAISPIPYQSNLSITGLAKVDDGIVSIPIEPEKELVTDRVVNFDVSAPSITTMKIEKNPFDESEMLLIFDGSDKESGISHFLVREKQWLIYGEPRRALNPYSVTPGAWAIKLIAVDNFGNESSDVLYRFSSLFWKLGFLAVLFFAVRFLQWMYRHYCENKLKNEK